MMAMIRSIITAVREGVIKRFDATARPGETFADRELFQHYGFTSRPLDGAEAIVIQKGNIVISMAEDDRRYRLAVEDGEVALYTDEGDFVHFKRGNLLHVSTGNRLLIDATAEVEVNTADATINAENSAQINTAAATINADNSAHINTGTATINATATAEVTAPLAVISAAAQCQILSPQIALGGSFGSLMSLVDQRVIDWLTTHTHPGDSGGNTGTPNQALAAGDVCTSTTKAG